jgi:hypothetical protein
VPTISVDEAVAAIPTSKPESTPPDPALVNAKSLRDVVGILYESEKDPDALVKRCQELREQLPALKTVEPSVFESRVRRQAIVLSGVQA